MKFLPFFVFFLSITLCFCRMKDKGSSGTATLLFNAKVSVVQDYCGGAEPSDDQLHPQPVAAPGVKLYIKSGTANNSSTIVDSVITDANGLFQIALIPGRYCIVEAKKRNAYVAPVNDQFNTWDTACYHKNYLECDYSLDLNTKDIGQKEIILYRHCNWTTPCVSYSGPFPPAAEHPHNE